MPYRKDCRLLYKGINTFLLTTLLSVAWTVRAFLARKALLGIKPSTPVSSVNAPQLEQKAACRLLFACEPVSGFITMGRVGLETGVSLASPWLLQIHRVGMLWTGSGCHSQRGNVPFPGPLGETGQHNVHKAVNKNSICWCRAMRTAVKRHVDVKEEAMYFHHCCWLAGVCKKNYPGKRFIKSAVIYEHILSREVGNTNWNPKYIVLQWLQNKVFWVPVCVPFVSRV